MVRFGPSGNSESFYEQGNKSSWQMPAWLKGMGLSAYEYPCGKGIHIGMETAVKIGQAAIENDIFMSVHAPYYINFASTEEDKRKASIEYVLRTLEVARWMGAKRIVVHTGACSNISRHKAMEIAIPVLKQVLQEADEAGYSDIAICPEVLGKHNQLGTLEEIIEMCREDERLLPTIDFGHLHARGLGCMNSIEDFERVIDMLENGLGSFRARNFHAHFSRIEYSKGGEKRHWTYSDTCYGPDFDPLAEVIVKRDLMPVIICESRSMMAEDALKLKSIYESTYLSS
jgi:deoxyribonuclease-4